MRTPDGLGYAALGVPVSPNPVTIHRRDSFAPGAGFEPAADRLTVDCSAAELPRNIPYACPGRRHHVQLGCARWGRALRCRTSLRLPRPVFQGPHDQPGMSGRHKKSLPDFVHTSGRHLMVSHELHACHSFTQNLSRRVRRGVLPSPPPRTTHSGMHGTAPSRPARTCRRWNGTSSPAGCGSGRQHRS